MSDILSQARPLRAIERSPVTAGDPVRPGSPGKRRAPTALALCVNYHAEALTRAFVADMLAQSPPCEVRVAVADNSEGAGSGLDRTTLALTDDRVRVIRPERNLGYFPAAARALEAVLASGPMPDWVIVANNDVRVPPDLMARVGRFYPAGGCAVLAPGIWSEASRHDQNPYFARRPSVARMTFYKWMSCTYPGYAAYEALGALKVRLLAVSAGRADGLPAYEDAAAVRRIYAPHGACIIFHRSYFEAGGTLDPGIAFYNEEMHVAETARRLGLTVLYDPRLRVRHHPHTTLKPFSRLTARRVAAASALAADSYFRGPR